MRTKLVDVRAAQPEWFSRGNRRMFGDLNYRVMHGKTTGRPFLIRATTAWTDMFGAAKRVHYRANPLDEKLNIRPLIDREFRDLGAVKDWLKAA